MSDAYDEGFEAFDAGQSETSNPYDPATDEHLDWNDGFAAAEEQA
jgi:hypothetical protein